MSVDITPTPSSSKVTEANLTRRGLDNVYVGRQAIYDRKLNVAAYELLYRDGLHAHATFTNQDQASRDTIVSAVCEIGLEHLGGELPCFVNIGEALLLSGACLHLPKDRLVIEILENVRPTNVVIDPSTASGPSSTRIPCGSP